MSGTGTNIAGRWLSRSVAAVAAVLVVAVGGACEDEARVASTGKTPSASPTEPAPAPTTASPSTTIAAPTTVPVPASTTAPPASTTAPPTSAKGATPTPVPLSVRSVTDGDTLVVTDGRRVRLAQVDAPETSQCFGAQATDALRRLAGGQAVTLRRPSNGPETDRYGRTLAEVYIGGRSINEALVSEGAAEWFEQFAGEDADLAGRLRSAEEDARRAGRGLWSACGGTGPAPTAPPATVAQGSSSASCHPAYPDDCIPPPPPDLDCGDIRRKVRVDHAHGDPHRLDADGDGWGCESYG